MANDHCEESDRNAVLVFTSSMPGFLLRLFISFLRMKRGAVKAEKRLFRTMVKGGIPKPDARKLASEYFSITSVSYWMKKGRNSAMKGWKK
jgi:hypothetical protein